MDICGNESSSNIKALTKINIWNFVFLGVALICKLAACAIGLIHVLDLINGHHFVQWEQVLNSGGFVLLLVACSLQLYKWIIIILRVQFFGHGSCDLELYQLKLRLSKQLFIVMATIAPVFNLLLIFIEIFKYQSISKATAISILLSVSIQTVIFLVVGSLVIRKLHVYFRDKYDL
jgi:hypothetical protein